MCMYCICGVTYCKSVLTYTILYYTYNILDMHIYILHILCIGANMMTPGIVYVKFLKPILYTEAASREDMSRYVYTLCMLYTVCI